MIALCMMNTANAQNMNFNTFSFNAEIVQHDIPNCEVSSYLDNQNNTHIAWIKTVGSNQYLMYSVYNNVTINTITIPTSINTERKAAPYLILDANNHPHITYFVKRDLNNSSQYTGNYAIMYAGDPEGDGSFEVNQVSTNPSSPTSNTANIFDCDVNGRPNISLDGNDILISYMSRASSLTSYDNWIIFAKKSASSWNRTQEYNIEQYGVTCPTPSNDISLPYKMTPNYHNAWLDISNYNPRFNFKNGSTWSNIALTQYSGYMNIYNTQIDYDNSNNIHFMWFSDDSSRYYHANINGSIVGTIEEYKIIGQTMTTSNFHPASVDMTTGKPFMSFQKYSNSNIYVMTKNSSNNVIETNIPSIGTYYGKRCLNINNGFISLVTASQTNSKIYISTNTGTNSLPDFSYNNITIYPNPATNNLCINLQQLKNLQNTTVSVFDMQGKLLLQQIITQQQTELNINHFAKGIYVVKVQNEKEIIQSKFIKE